MLNGGAFFFLFAVPFEGLSAARPAFSVVIVTFENFGGRHRFSFLTSTFYCLGMQLHQSCLTVVFVELWPGVVGDNDPFSSLSTSSLGTPY